MKITLKPEQEKFIEAQVTSGRYPSAAGGNRSAIRTP